MNANLPPLTGAILISNPRKDNPMALALENPNDRRDLNKVTRIIMKQHGGDISAIADVASQLKRFGGSGIARQGTKGSRGAAFGAALPGAAKMTKERKKQYNRVRRAVAKFFGTHSGYKSRRVRPGKGRRGTISYASAAIGPKARRYRMPQKRKEGRAFGKVVQVVNVEGVRKFNADRVARRGGVRGAGIVKPWTAGYVPLYGGRGGPRVRTGRRKTARGKRVATPAQLAALAKGRAVRAAKRAAKANPFGALALENSYGALALENPGALGVMGALTSLATLGAGVGAGLFANQFILPTVEPWLENIPVVKDAPVITTGLLGGLALGLIAGTAWVRGNPMLAQGTALLGTGMAAAGVAVGLAQGELGLFGGGGDEEEELGALALENGLGALALENFGDGMYAETAPLSADMGDLGYGQSSLGDALYSGPDFSAEEGQAILNGPAAWGRRFGAPPRSVMRLSGRPSHLAGRRGHRWGWLVKVLGWERARAVAAMAPKDRVAFIKKLRESAVATFQAEAQSRMADASSVAAAAAAPVPAAGDVATAPAGAMGPTGAGGELGAALFMGA